MNIREIKTPITAATLNESLAKRYGTKIDISKFTLPQLEDARNKVRTMLKDIETNESFDSVKSESYQKSKLFLDVLNQAIKEAPPIIEAPEEKMPSKAEVMKCCKDGMSVAEICKKYPDCDQDKLKALCKECKDEMKESVNEGEGKEMALPSGKEIKKCADDGMSKAEIVKKYTEMGCNEQKVKKLYDAHCG